MVKLKYSVETKQTAPAVETGAAEAKWPFDVTEVAPRGRVVIHNPRAGKYFLVQREPTVLNEITFEACYQGLIGISIRIVIPELDGRVLVEPQRLPPVLMPIGERDIKVERFIIPEAFEDHFLKGRQGVVVHLDGKRVIASHEVKSTHNSSPSVGAPNSAVRHNPNPTEGELDNHEGDTA